MTHKLTVSVLSAALVLSLMAGCGISTDSAIQESSADGLQTFGVAVDPSAEPSRNAEVSPSVSTQQAAGNTDPMGQSDDGEAGEATPAASAETTASPSTRPSASRNTASPSTAPAASPASSANISPPAPASTASYETVAQYVGKQFSELVAAEGYPSSTEYDYIDEEDPSKGEIGTLYYDGFTVTTRRDADGEIITAITPDTSSQPDEDE